MTYVEQIREFETNILNDLREKLEKHGNKDISIKDFKKWFPYEYFGLDWKNDMVLIDEEGHGYSLCVLDEYELAEFADYILSKE